MNSTKPAVAYVFSHVRRQPRSISELRAEAALVRQRHQLLSWARANDVKFVGHHVDVTTYRKKPFTSTDTFLRAVADADARTCELILGDLWELLRRTPPDMIVATMEALTRTPVEIVDATTGRRWSSFTGQEHRRHAVQCGAAHHSRSRAARDGLSLNRKPRAPSPPENRKRGSLANKRKAQSAANRHADFVRAERQKLGPDDKLSPSSLARSLNNAGIPAARGGKWTHNAAKNLLDRLDSQARLYHEGEAP